MVESMVAKEVISIISEISGVDEEEIKPESKFNEDLDIDSIRAIEVTVALEKKFKISIRDEYVPTILTVGDAIEVVNNIMKASS